MLGDKYKKLKKDYYMYGKLMNESLKVLIENKKALFKALILPILFLLVITLLFPNIIDKGKMVFEDNIIKIISILLGIITLLINLSIAVSVHRIILIKDDISLIKSVATTKREVDFFGKSLILVILSGLVFIVVFFFSMALFRIFILDTQLLTICSIAFSGLLASIIFSRFSMILPSVAIDKKMDFLDTLEFTKNYKFLSLFMVVIFPFIIAILIAVVYGIVIKFFSVIISSYFEILYVFLNVFITVLVISCLSVTYSYIEKENNQKKFL